MKIIICTLRRSGSTVFWKAFRDNTDFTCYDEPFNPGLSILPKEHKKQVYGEYIDLIHKDAKAFWEAYVPIAPVEENKEQLSEAQKTYLKYLLDSDEHVVIDTTRCWNKLESLKEVLEPYPHLFIHLYRDPIAFTSSHLLPSEIKSWRLNRTLKKEFWTKKEGFNHWKLEEVLGHEVDSAFHSLVLSDLTDAILKDSFYDQPAYEKLLVFWNLVFNRVQSQGKALFGDNYIAIVFEAFCREPKAVLNNLKENYDIDFSSMALNLHEPNPGFDTENKLWHAYNFKNDE